jgi:hypothetical protein
MKRPLILAAAGTAATLVAFAPAEAHFFRNWRTFAYTQVNGRDTDTIRLPGTARYRQLRLCVFNGPIEMRDLDVRFRNGGHQDVNVRHLLRPGSCTRNIDLAGRRRDVTSIRIKYSPLARGFARPIVRVQVR